MTKQFRPQRKNANKHTLHGTRLLEKSIQQDGFIDAQTAAADGEIISGSLRLEVSAEKFADVEPIIVESDGKRPVIVVRTDIPNADDPRAKRLSIAANQIGATDWNPDADLLKEWGNEDADIKAMFAADEWKEFTGEEKPTKDAEPQTDRAAELLEKWKVSTGDLWQIGDHRLICGDCTDAAVVARVMDGEKADMVFTDPPWNVDYKGGTKKREELANDDIEVGWDEWLTDALRIIPAKDNAPAYVFFGLMRAGDTQHGIEAAGWRIVQTLVWVKQHAQFGNFRAHYKYQHEPMYYCSIGKKVPAFYGPNNEVSVWTHDRASRNDNHPTEKPIDVAAHGIKNSSKEGEIVFDGFHGGGTSMVACQNLGRRCRAVEISPAYVSVALERMATAFPDLPIVRLE